MISPELDPSTSEIIARLHGLLDKYRDRRVVVVGPTCCGKSVLVEYTPGAADMDKVLFPMLTQEETDFVNQQPWTPEIGETMNQLARSRIKIEPGHPVFGTVVLDADVAINLKISPELLTERAAQRNVASSNPLSMQKKIDSELKTHPTMLVVDLWLG